MPNIFLRSFLTLPPPPRSTLFPYTTLFRSRLRFRIRREVRARSGSDQFRLAGALEERESRTSLPSLRSEEHTSELQSLRHLVCRLLLEKKKASKSAAMFNGMRTHTRYPNRF